MLLLHQIAEDALERVVQWFDTLQANRRGLCEPRELDLQVLYVAAQDHERTIGVDVDGIYRCEPDDFRRELTRRVIVIEGLLIR